MSTWPGSWTCHVCGDERPDERISVYKTEVRTTPSGVQFSAHVRYCNDRAACAAGAPAIAEKWIAGIRRP